MPQQFIDDPNVALKWKLYAHLNGYWIGGKTVYARNDTLAKAFNKSERAIQSALCELEELGLITRNIQGLSRYILPGGIKLEGRSPASPIHEAQLHPRDEAQLHHTSDNTTSDSLPIAAEPRVNVKLNENGDEEKTAGSREVLEAFKESNPSYKTLLSRKAQHDAARRLIEIHGLQTVLEVARVLPETNKLPYFTPITTPIELESGWAKLEAKITQRRVEKPKIRGRGFSL